MNKQLNRNPHRIVGTRLPIFCRNFYFSGCNYSCRLVAVAPYYSNLKGLGGWKVKGMGGGLVILPPTRPGQSDLIRLVRDRWIHHCRCC